MSWIVWLALFGSVAPGIIVSIWGSKRRGYPRGYLPPDDAERTKPR